MIIRNILKQVKLSKKGTPFASVSVQFDEYTENGKRIWINGFGNKYTWAWKIGDDVQPEVKQEGKYYNFTFMDDKENALEVYRLPATVGFVLDLFKSHRPAEKPTVEGKGMPAEDIPDDIPF